MDTKHFIQIPQEITTAPMATKHFIPTKQEVKTPPWDIWQTLLQARYPMRLLSAITQKSTPPTK